MSYPLTNQFGDIYARQARSAMLSSTSDITRGTAPQRVFIAEFVYANGLVTQYDGKSWLVVRPEKEIKS